MKFSESWLREWVNPDLDSAALTEQLTMAGLEVDGVEPVAGSFSDVIVAEVRAVAAHPDADKLSVCEVYDGQNSHTVVCGAPNVRAGLQVAYARVGAILPDESGRGFKIRRAKLRGVESFGMLCSEQELQIGDDHDGIMELPAGLTVGDDLRAALDLDDCRIELDLTPNRGDCLSIRGVAREVALLNDVPLNEPQIPVVAPTCDAAFPVVLSDPGGCPRYLGRVIRGINPQARTPRWMVEKLRRAGLREIDPTVDITNYVMLELGQPMHAFDLAQLSGGIDVRMARAGDRLTLLDGREIEPDLETLLITDGNGPVALAGVMGGERSGISATTEDVFLECAFFDRLALAGTARRYGLHTDASHRYERGVDFELQELAVERATALLLEICGGEPGPIVVTEDRQHLPERLEVSVGRARLEKLLGIRIEDSEIDRIFAQLQFEVVARDAVDDDVRWTIRAPSHRFDVAIEADLVEEVCRVYGYNNVEARRPNQSLELGQVAIEQTTDRRLRELLVDLGYQESISYSFLDPVLVDAIEPGVEALTLANPMSVDLSAMRTSLLPGLIDAARRNVARQADRLRLFEIGLSFVPGEQGLQQSRKIAGLILGAREPESWASQAQDVDFFDIKGDVERLLEQLGWPTIEALPLDHSALHPGQSASLRAPGQDRPLGRIGRLHPQIEERFELGGAAFVFELDTDAILTRAKPGFAPLSRYPRVRRDLALIVDRALPVAQLEAACREALAENLVDFTLFDVYTGKGIDSNEKSVALGLTLQSPSATLTDAEIGAFVDQAVASLASLCGARLR